MQTRESAIKHAFATYLAKELFVQKLDQTNEMRKHASGATARSHSNVVKIAARNRGKIPQINSVPLCTVESSLFLRKYTPSTSILCFILLSNEVGEQKADSHAVLVQKRFNSIMRRLFSPTRIVSCNSPGR